MTDLPPSVKKAQLLIGAYLMTLSKRDRRAAMERIMRHVLEREYPDPEEDKYPDPEEER